MILVEGKREEAPQSSQVRQFHLVLAFGCCCLFVLILFFKGFFLYKIYWKELQNPWCSVCTTSEEWSTLSGDDVWLTGTHFRLRAQDSNSCLPFTTRGSSYSECGQTQPRTVICYCCVVLDSRERKEKDGRKGKKQEEGEWRRRRKQGKDFPQVLWRASTAIRTDWTGPGSARWTWRCTLKLSWLYTAGRWFLASRRYPRSSLKLSSASCSQGKHELTSSGDYNISVLNSDKNTQVGSFYLGTHLSVYAYLWNVFQAD